MPPPVWDPVAQVMQLPAWLPLYLVSPPHEEQLELSLLAYRPAEHPEQ